MSWPQIDPQILGLLLDGGEALAHWAWHELSGGTSTDADKKAIDAIRRRAIEAAAKAAQDELEQQAAKRNLEIQLAKLGSLFDHIAAVATLFDHVENPTVPVLDLPIEIVPPDAVLEDPTKPGGE